jgi:hypothetical protein
MTEQVSTYANGFGAWHATVYLVTPVAELSAKEQSRIRTKARRAIRRELIERSNGIDKLPPIHTVLWLTGHNDAGDISHVTYREVWA